MVAVPFATPLTLTVPPEFTEAAETVAMAVSFDTIVQGRPGSSAPLDARAVIVSVTELPALMSGDPGETVTVLTARRTRTVFVPVTPPTSAEIVAVENALLAPFTPTPVTVNASWPAASVLPDVGATVATEVGLLLRVTA
jgi:hypothetical protein